MYTDIADAPQSSSMASYSFLFGACLLCLFTLYLSYSLAGLFSRCLALSPSLCKAKIIAGADTEETNARRRRFILHKLLLGALLLRSFLYKTQFSLCSLYVVVEE